MKKIIVVLAIATISLLNVNQVQAQSFAIGGGTGFRINTGFGTNLALPIAASFEWAMNESMSLQAHVGYDLGLRGGDLSVFYVSPEFRYHFAEVFDGVYVGGFLGFGPGSFSTFNFSVGGTVGYEILISEKFNLDISSQVGLGLWSSGGSAAGLHFRPTVGFRYLI